MCYAKKLKLGEGKQSVKNFLWRHKSLVGIWLIVFGIGGYAGYLLFVKPSGNENPYVLSETSKNAAAPEEAAAEPAEEEIKRVGLNETAKDGDLEFTATGINCEDRTVGTNQYAMDEAEGQFCRLAVAIKNLGTAPADLPASQTLITPTGEESSLDIQATQYAQEDQAAGYWYEDIAPGKAVTGDLLFDVSGGQAASVILHGTQDSPGIEVNLQ